MEHEMQLEEGRVVSHVQLAPAEYLLTLHAPDIAAKAQPGQFVTLQISEQIQPLLRRPISIHDVDADNGLVLLYYHVVGTGTELLSRLQAGDTISLLGPLGHGFDTTMAASRVYMVGGGIGQAPLRYLARVLKEQGKEVVAVMGARDAEGLKAVDFYEANGIPLKLSTEDGSLGSQGFVTDHLQNLAAERVDVIYTCGPKPMLRAVKALAEAQQIPCQVSLEEKMACGVGVCLGCTCKSSDPEAPYPKVCTHGPVFWAQEVDLND